MSSTQIDREKFRRAFILILLVLISVIFLRMIRGFILTGLMAAIFAGLTYPYIQEFPQTSLGPSVSSGRPDHIEKHGLWA